MQPLCKPPAVPRFDQKPHRSFVPNKFQSAVRAAAVESPPSDCDPKDGRRAGALHGRDHSGISVGVRVAVQLTLERTTTDLVTCSPRVRSALSRRSCMC